MEGVTILNTIAEDIHAGGFNMGVVLGILLIIVGALLVVGDIVSGDIDETIFLSLLGIIAGIIAISGCYPNGGPVIKQDYTYEVIIDDSVNFNEFTEQYTIISKRGDIYEVKEK